MVLRRLQARMRMPTAEERAKYTQQQTGKTGKNKEKPPAKRKKKQAADSEKEPPAPPSLEACASDVTHRMLCLPTGDRGSKTVYGNYVERHDQACEAAVSETYKDKPTELLDYAARAARDKLPQAQRNQVKVPRMLKVPAGVKKLTQAIDNYPLRPCEAFWGEYRNQGEEKQSLSDMEPAKKKSHFEDWLKRVSAVSVLLQLEELKQKQQSKRKRKPDTIPGQIEGAAADDGEPHKHHKKQKHAEGKQTHQHC